MNIHLVNFYKTWLHWATHENAANPMGFRKTCGLCSNLSRYIEWLGNLEVDYWGIRFEMDSQFEAAGLPSITPFEEYMHYSYELDKRKNPLRIQFVKDRIAEVEALPHA